VNRRIAYRAWRCVASLSAGLILGCGRPADAQAPFVLSEGYIGEEVPPEIERSYERGLRFLVSRQSPEGGWKDSGGQSGPGIDGLCLLAFAASGTDLRYGPYAATVQRGLIAVLAQQNADGYFGPSMYHHGFATLALAELYGMLDEPRLGPALARAVNVILDAQKKSQQKAWRYSPQSTDADATVTGAQMVALFAARNAGLQVPDEAIRHGVEFYRRVQGPDGSIGYTSPDSGSPPRNAIAVVVASLAQQKHTHLFQGAWTWLTSRSAQSATIIEQYFFYYLYYAAQAYFRADMDAWRSWNRTTSAALIAAQNAQGGWDGQFGPSFCTATALLSMALNYRYLPIYER
jgi:hypothetical protein